MLEESHYYFNKAADVLGLSPTIREILLTPRRMVKVEVVTQGCDGRLRHNLGFRVQHNNARGGRDLPGEWSHRRSGHPGELGRSHGQLL